MRRLRSVRRPGGAWRSAARGAWCGLAAAAAVLSAACRQAPARATQAGLAADSADHVMTGVRSAITNAGVRQANLEADTAYVYENTGRTSVKVVKVTFFSTTGVQQSVLTADSGWYETRSGLMEARGNVLVVRADGARLTTSLLRYDPARNQVTTDQPYVAIEGERRFQGTGFVSDPSFSNVTTQAVRGTGGRYTLPGQ